MNVFSTLIEAANRWPETLGIVSNDGSLTYSELFREAESLQRELLASGVRPGMGLGLIAKNSPEFVIGLMAGLACEAVVMPLSHELKEQELSRALELIPMAAILHDGNLTSEPRWINRSSHRDFQIVTLSSEFHGKVASGVPQAAVIRFTSGTTGSSKGVVLSHRTVTERTAAAGQALALRPGMRILWALPMAHHFVVSILAYVRFGVTLVLADDSTPQSILAAAERYSPELFYASPPILESLAVDTSNSPLPKSMRVISTSTGMSRDNLRLFDARFGLPVHQMYGLIEVGLPLGNLASSAHPFESVGAPIPPYEAAILDPQGRRLPAGQIGRLAVKGPGMFDAYLAPYRPREEVLVNGWFITGDLGVQSYSGAFTVCGRERSVIHCNGEKVFPEEVEGVLNSYPGIKSSRVFGIQGTNLEDTSIAEIVPHAGTTLDLEAVRSYASERLSHHKVPTRFVSVSSIPLTPTGKVIRAS
jgi:acyl-CoA synthetase (AMP-forming)/AMP-acid ligase II